MSGTGPSLIDDARAFASWCNGEGLATGGSYDVRLARFAVAFADALPRLRREHDRECFKASPRLIGTVAGTPYVDNKCTCGASADNAKLRELAALLGLTPETPAT